MRERVAKGLDRVDRVGGKVVARFWGTILGAVIVAVLLPMFVSSISNDAWIEAVVVFVAALALVALARYLFSRDRRLTDFE